MELTREAALELLMKYNKESFHILHGLTVEGVMRWYAMELGYGAEADFWAMAGLLHDVDFEMYPEQHCIKAPDLLAEVNASPNWFMPSAPMPTVSAVMWSPFTRWKK